jgi:hypothetical protein
MTRVRHGRMATSLIYSHTDKEKKRTAVEKLPFGGNIG